MKKAFTRLLSLLALSIVSLAGYAADYTINLSTVAKAEYSYGEGTIGLTEFCEKLGVTDKAEYAALWGDGSTATPVYIGDNNVAYTAGLGGFWMDAESNVMNWGDDAVWYISTEANTEDDVMYFWAGLRWSSTEDAKYSTTIYFTNGDKTVSVDINFDVTGYAPAELTINDAAFTSNPVKIIDFDMTQTQRNDYNTESYSIPLDEIAAGLGLTVDEMSEFDPLTMIYAQEGLVDDSTVIAHNYISNNLTQGSGYWFGTVEDEESNEFVGICSWGSSALFYITNFEFADGAYTFELGQYPSALEVTEEGAPYTTPIYFLYGDKKVQVNLNLYVEGNITLDLSETTTVAEYDLVSKQIANNSYNTSTVKVDIKAIASALGADESFVLSDAVLYGMLNDEEASNSYTTSATGFWLNAEGKIATWTDKVTSPWFIDLNSSKGFDIGQFPYAFDTDEETGVAPNDSTMTTTLYLVYGEKNVKFNITLKIVSEEELDKTELENVGDIYVVHNATADTGYGTTSFAIDTENLANLFGVASYDDLNLDVKLSWVNPETGTETQNDPGSCAGDSDTGTGFWVSAEGQDVGWGTSAYAGISYNPDNGAFWFYQMPDNAVVGNTTVATLLLQDETLGKQVTAHITFNIVEEVIEYDYVKTFTVTALFGNDTETTVTLPLDEIIEALGTDKDTYMSEVQFLASNQGVIGSSLYESTESGYYVTAKGAATGDYEEAAFTVRYADPISDAVTAAEFEFFDIETFDPLEEGAKTYTTLYLALGEKIVTINITIGESVGIDGVSVAKATAGKVYDLNGRRVNNNAKGIVIKDGKKILVK